MFVKEEQFNALFELVNTMKSKLDLYEKYENAREKEFRELERDVYRLKTGRGANISSMSGSLERIQQAREMQDNQDAAGTAWLR